MSAPLAARIFGSHVPEIDTWIWLVSDLGNMGWRKLEQLIQGTQQPGQARAGYMTLKLHLVWATENGMWGPKLASAMLVHCDDTEN